MISHNLEMPANCTSLDWEEARAPGGIRHNNLADEHCKRSTECEKVISTSFVAATCCFRPQGLTRQRRLCLTISQRRFRVVTRVDTPRPHVREQALHTDVCSIQFRLGSKPSVSSCLYARFQTKKTIVTHYCHGFVLGKVLPVILHI